MTFIRFTYLLRFIVSELHFYFVSMFIAFYCLIFILVENLRKLTTFIKFIFKVVTFVKSLQATEL